MEFDDYTEDMEALDEAPEMTELDEMLQELPDWEEDTEAEGMDDALMEALEKSPGSPIAPNPRLKFSRGSRSLSRFSAPPLCTDM